VAACLPLHLTSFLHPQLSNMEKTTGYTDELEQSLISITEGTTNNNRRLPPTCSPNLRHWCMAESYANCSEKISKNDRPPTALTDDEHSDRGEEVQLPLPTFVVPPTTEPTEKTRGAEGFNNELHAPQDAGVRPQSRLTRLRNIIGLYLEEALTGAGRPGGRRKEVCTKPICKMQTLRNVKKRDLVEAARLIVHVATTTQQSLPPNYPCFDHHSYLFSGQEKSFGYDYQTLRNNQALLQSRSKSLDLVLRRALREIAKELYIADPGTVVVSSENPVLRKRAVPGAETN
ncbi:hypothetical protein J6590_107541, partial [Homalodisca vitripennis]